VVKPAERGLLDRAGYGALFAAQAGTRARTTGHERRIVAFAWVAGSRTNKLTDSVQRGGAGLKKQGRPPRGKRIEELESVTAGMQFRDALEGPHRTDPVRGSPEAT
jgi:hypothetical protein